MHRIISPKKALVRAGWIGAGLVLIPGCFGLAEPDPEPQEQKTREETIPPGATKMTPEMDLWPPVSHSQEWEQPVPFAGPVNTAGAEDAPIITPDGSIFVFFFTPDVGVPVGEQLYDGVTGVWWCTKDGAVWNEPERALLVDDGEVALDGPFCMQGNTLWFCSARVGNYRELDIYTATLDGGIWGNWANAGHLLNMEYWVGELYTTGDGATMYYDSDREGGHGAKDIWEIRREAGQWAEPVNLGATINTDLDEGWLYVNPDGSELWFTRWSGLGYMGPALFRSVKEPSGAWSEPEEVVSNFAGDPAMDADRNIYFTHHFFTADVQMIEADIYVAYHR